MISRWWDPGIGEEDWIGIGSHQDKDHGGINGGYLLDLGDIDYKTRKGNYRIFGRIGLMGDWIPISIVSRRRLHGYQGILAVDFWVTKIERGFTQALNFELRKVRFGWDSENHRLQNRSLCFFEFHKIYFLRFGLIMVSHSGIDKDLKMYYKRASGMISHYISFKSFFLTKSSRKKGSYFLGFTMTQGQLVGTM